MDSINDSGGYTVRQKFLGVAGFAGRGTCDAPLPVGNMGYLGTDNY
jgi:hypothetical protein